MFLSGLEQGIVADLDGIASIPCTPFLPKLLLAILDELFILIFFSIINARNSIVLLGSSFFTAQA